MKLRRIRRRLARVPYFELRQAMFFREMLRETDKVIFSYDLLQPPPKIFAGLVPRHDRTIYWRSAP